VSANGQYQSACINSATGTVWYSLNYGATWTQATITANQYYTGISMSATGKYQVTGVNGAGGKIYTSTNYGATWTVVSSSYTGVWNGFCVSASGQYMTGVLFNYNYTAYIYYSSDYGVTWTQATGPAAGINWLDVCCSASGQYQTATSNGSGIWYSTNYGASWTLASGTSTGVWINVCCSATGQYQTAAVLNGSIYTSTNYGVTWTIVSGTSATNWNCVGCNASGQYQLAGISTGTIYYSTDYGATWTTTGAASTAWGHIAMSQTGQYILAASSSGVYSAVIRSPSLYTNGGIITSGTVGIGTTSLLGTMDVWGPSSKVSIYGITPAEAYALSSSSKYTYFPAGTQMSLQANANSVNAGCLIDYNAPNSAGGSSNVFAGAIAGTGNGPANFVIGRRTGVTSWAESIRVDTSGNVGIGTTSPATTLDVAGTIQGQTAFQSSASANNVGLGSLQSVYLGLYGAAAPRGTSVRWGDVLGAAYYVTTGGYNLSFFKDVSGGNAAMALQFIGIGSTNASPNVYVPNSLGIGTNSPATTLQLYNSNNPKIFLNGGAYTGFVSLAVGSAALDFGFDTTTISGSTTGGIIRFFPNGTESVRIANNGNVGISTTSPAQLLHVYGDGARVRIDSTTANNSVLELKTKTSISYLFTDQSGNLQIYPNTTSLNLLLQPSGGFVGIGTATPQCQLHVHSANGASGSAVINYGGTGPGYIMSWNGTAGVLSGSQRSAGATGIFSFNDIVTANNLIAMDFVSFSDIRIKKNIKSFDRCAIDLINQLRIVSYDHIDYQKPSCGAGLVAQEIETIFPECIKHHREIIPNIYRPAIHSLSESMVLIQLINERGDPISRSDPDILSAKRISLRVSTDTHFDMVMDMDLIYTDGSIFHVKKWENYHSEDKVFVYGTEVEDFRVIDKEMVAMVAVRAIQEHNSMVMKQAEQIADLQTQMATLLGRLNAAGL
jgi:hypothetical protein